jgi:hypothetical protein
MPAYTEDYQQIEEARRRAASLGQQALTLQSGAETFSDKVMKEVRAARAARGTSMLASDIGATTGQLASGGAEARERLAMVNPLQADVLTARERAGTLGTLATQAQVQEGIEGTIQDIIGGGVNQLKAAALVKQAEAEKATQEANTLLEQVKLREEQEARAFQQMMAEKEFGLAQEKFAWEKTRPTGGAAGLTPHQQLTWLNTMGKIQGEMEEAANDASYKIGKLDEAIKLLEEDRVRVGPIVGKFLPLAARLGDKDSANFWRIVQEATTQEMFKIGGKVLPAQEIERLKPFLPTEPTVTKEKMLGDLKNLRNNFAVAAENEIGRYQSQLAPLQMFLGGSSEEWTDTGNVTER